MLQVPFPGGWTQSVVHHTRRGEASKHSTHRANEYRGAGVRLRWGRGKEGVVGGRGQGGGCGCGYGLWMLRAGVGVGVRTVLYS